MTRRARPVLVVLLALLAAALLSACSGSGPTLKADTEGIYLDIGHLKYQVQLSRQLNQSDPEDVAYLKGLTPAERRLAPSQAWFAVWMLVENHTSATQPPSSSFRILDTQGKGYAPLFPDATNVYAYRATPIPVHGQIPAQGTPALSGPIQGSLLLFKVNVASFDNRPLVMSIDDPVTGKSGTVDLDV